MKLAKDVMTHKELFEALLSGKKITKTNWGKGEYLHLVGDTLMEADPIPGENALLVINTMGYFELYEGSKNEIH